MPHNLNFVLSFVRKNSSCLSWVSLLCKRWVLQEEGLQSLTKTLCSLFVVRCASWPARALPRHERVCASPAGERIQRSPILHFLLMGPRHRYSSTTPWLFSHASHHVQPICLLTQVCCCVHSFRLPSEFMTSPLCTDLTPL